MNIRNQNKYNTTNIYHVKHTNIAGKMNQVEKKTVQNKLIRRLRERGKYEDTSNKIKKENENKRNEERSKNTPNKSVNSNKPDDNSSNGSTLTTTDKSIMLNRFLEDTARTQQEYIEEKEPQISDEEKNANTVSSAETANQGTEKTQQEKAETAVTTKQENEIRKERKPKEAKEKQANPIKQNSKPNKQSNNANQKEETSEGKN